MQTNISVKDYPRTNYNYWNKLIESCSSWDQRLSESWVWNTNSCLFSGIRKYSSGFLFLLIIHFAFCDYLKINSKLIALIMIQIIFSLLISCFQNMMMVMYVQLFHQFYFSSECHLLSLRGLSFRYQQMIKSAYLYLFFSKSTGLQVFLPCL